jgi:ABC-2 type transport system permease protein
MTTPMWRLVAEREVTTRLRDKTFLVSTAVLLLIVLGGIVVSSIVGGRPPSFDLAVTGQSGSQLAQATEAALRGAERSRRRAGRRPPGGWGRGGPGGRPGRAGGRRPAPG